MHFFVRFRKGMNGLKLSCLVFWILLIVGHDCSEYLVSLSHNAPAVLGATLTFTADLYTKYDVHPNGTFGYRFNDNAIPGHNYQVYDTSNTTVMWNVSYPRSKYPPGVFRAQVVAAVKTWDFYLDRASERINFNLTDTLNGDIKIEQANVLDAGTFVANNLPVKHSINLSPADQNYLKTHATNVLTFWFVDCQYYGYSTDYSFSFNYTQKKTHDVEALVVASFDPPEPTTTPMTTTSTTTTTTKPPTNVSSVTSSTAAPKLTLTQLPENATLMQKEVNSSSPEKAATFFPAKNGTLSENLTGIHSYACLNSTFVPLDPNKTYGYFRKQIDSIAPVSNVIVKGNNWLQFGDMLNLNITCNGTAKFYHCAKIKPGVYNITGNETCASSLESKDCNFSLRHLFRETSTYTIVIIISNDVSKVVQQSVIRMYTVTRQPQLSVIVVPVTFSLLTIILIVFGVAYYVQSRTRFTVEVADFDFGQANEIEYKTFYERLRDDLSNIFSRSGDMIDEANVISARNKYDNMENS